MTANERAGSFNGPDESTSLWSWVEQGLGPGWEPAAASFVVWLALYLTLSALNGNVHGARSASWNVRLMTFAHAVVALVSFMHG